MDQMITKTLAEIYLEQGHLEKAYEIYRALLERNPSDLEIQKRLNELGEKLSLSSSRTPQTVHPTDERIRLLERWLANIRERKRG